jgi:ATP-dependent DNA helicase DinG
MLLVESIHGMASAFGELAKVLGELADRIGDIGEAFGDQAASFRLEVQGCRDRVLAVATDLALFLTEKEGVCRWLELRQMKEESIVRFCTAPVEVGPGLRRALFEPCPTVVMTSATLTVDRRFNYMLERLGLSPARPKPARRAMADSDDLPVIQVDDVEEEEGTAEAVEERLATRVLDTPFDYDRQALVAVPTDVADPTEPAYARDLESMIRDAVAISRGRAFVLFTSYRLLQRLHDALKPGLESIGCTPLRQGMVNRHHLLNRFRHERAPVLFATSSFWEGVDVRGDALVLLILTRLPFRVPSDPIVEARVEFLERQGRDAFADYTVPQAVIKFKQGFGRLIRHKADRGAVLIFDRRVATKRYGATFLHSLPASVVHQLPRDEMLEALRAFFVANHDHS